MAVINQRNQRDQPAVFDAVHVTLDYRVRLIGG